jgi:hypothetical protein
MPVFIDDSPLLGLKTSTKAIEHDPYLASPELVTGRGQGVWYVGHVVEMQKRSVLCVKQGVNLRRRIRRKRF